jgi:AcrR family transcriptional regulator
MEQAGSLMTISAVAREVGVSSSTIHNRYSDLAERIREYVGDVSEKDIKSQLARRHGQIKDKKAKRARVREELEEVKQLLRKVNSVNAALQFENAALKSQLDELRHQNRAKVSQMGKTVT